jgi:hypothetical protein
MRTSLFGKVIGLYWSSFNLLIPLTLHTHILGPSSDSSFGETLLLDLVLEWHDLIALLDLDLDLGLDLDLDFPESGSRLSGTIFILPLQGT